MAAWVARSGLTVAFVGEAVGGFGIVCIQGHGNHSARGQLDGMSDVAGPVGVGGLLGTRDPFRGLPKGQLGYTHG